MPVPTEAQEQIFLLTPLREGRPVGVVAFVAGEHFYSRPCGRGDARANALFTRITNFYSRPCGRGDKSSWSPFLPFFHFYSRPCGRGDGRLLPEPLGS